MRKMFQKQIDANDWLYSVLFDITCQTYLQNKGRERDDLIIFDKEHVMFIQRKRAYRFKSLVFVCTRQYFYTSVIYKRIK